MTTKRPVIKNPSALRDYHLEKSFEAGLQLQGNEVKSLRGANANLKGSFAKILNGELLLYNMHISPYEFSRDDYDPLRPRKLLLHKKRDPAAYDRVEPERVRDNPGKSIFQTRLRED